MLPDNNQTLCWELISHRESGFDFISLDFDILQQLLPYLSLQPAQELQHAMTRWSTAGGKTRKGNDKSAYIPRASRITRTTNDTLRAILTRLIGQWEDDSIPETSQLRTMASTSISDVEKKWGIPVSERSLRRRSDESGWVRIDLQGTHNIDGSWLANIQGQWLEVPVFQVIVPAGKHLGCATIQRAMLKSLAEGLTIEVRATPSTPTPTPGMGGSPDTIPRPQGLGDDGRTNSLALTLDSIMIGSLMHDEL